MLRPLLLSIAILLTLYAACDVLYVQRHPCFGSVSVCQ